MFKILKKKNKKNTMLTVKCVIIQNAHLILFI